MRIKFRHELTNINFYWVISSKSPFLSMTYPPRLAVVLPALAPVHAVQPQPALETREAALVELLPVHNQLDV